MNKGENQEGWQGPVGSTMTEGGLETAGRTPAPSRPRHHGAETHLALQTPTSTFWAPVTRPKTADSGSQTDLPRSFTSPATNARLLAGAPRSSGPSFHKALGICYLGLSSGISQQLLELSGSITLSSTAVTERLPGARTWGQRRRVPCPPGVQVQPGDAAERDEW